MSISTVLRRLALPLPALAIAAAGLSATQQPASLAHASIRVPTVRGTIDAAFDHAASGALRLAAQVPGNTQPELNVPLPDGTSALYVDQVRRDVTPENGYARLRALGAGCHVVSLEPDGEAPLDPRLIAACTSPPVIDPGRELPGCVSELLRGAP